MPTLKGASRLLLALLVLLCRTSIADAQWAGLANAFPTGNTEHCQLLTDGTVMCHEYNTNHWHRLKPDINGSYQNGTWDAPGFTVADMPNANDPTIGCVNCIYRPLFFTSQVLADGKVVVIGGEYNNLVALWTNIGFLYDPFTNTWSGQLTIPAGWCCSNGAGSGGIGDAQSIVLQNGTLLLATTAGTDLASFNEATLTFTALNPTGKDDGNDEENWNILPNGKVLTVDSTTVRRSELYDPATNNWEAAVDTQVNLADTGPGTKNSAEVGPAVLRPDGTMIQFSANPTGLNAVYDTATGLWTATGASGDFPVASGINHFAVADGPATLLPNGRVLVMASPVSSTNVFQRPSHFYEFDGTNLTAVADSPNAAAFTSYQGRFLLLPTGQPLLTAYNQCPCTGGVAAAADIQLYTNGGSPLDAWRPVVTSAPNNIAASSSYSISGKLFNGFSLGATYGDDAQMSTNYPLVRIRNIATGHVFYARTHGHSRMGVEAVGDPQIISTTFDTPAGLEVGPSELVVVANGIASEAITVNGVDLTITKTHSPSIFTQDDIGDTFTITVGNIGNAATNATVTVVDTLPAGLTATAMSGPGWTCNVGTLVCTRSDVLASPGSYPAITLTVNVSHTAPILVTNTATVSGGGEANSVNVTANDTAHDDVNIRQHTVTTVMPATQDYHDDVTLTATVTPAGVTGTVEFKIDGSSKGLGLYDSTTGVAALLYNIQEIPGAHTIEADFTSSNPLYLNSSGAATLTVTKEETTTTYTGPTVIANGLPLTVSGVLKEDGLVPIAGRTLTITLGTGGSAQSCSGVTDGSGSASCTINPVNQPLGPGTVKADFVGDAFYLPSSDTKNTILFAFLTNGAFAVGDVSAAGNPVTFWSATWSSANVLSGGRAPDAFKGFANHTAEPPACSGGWTSSNGGNSAGPPANVPSFMGVIVPSTAAKTGSTTSGDIVKIVVVQTNPEYGPNPGHPGTGTIVGTYCVKP